MTTLALRYAALTDVGLRRSNNQDSGYASSRLLVIADGMGGAAAGDLASSEALNIVRRLDAELDQDALTALELAVDRANQRLGELIADDPAVEGMGTTMEAMLWDGEKFAVAHLGDSRAYRLRGGTLTQLSTDHTFVQSLVEEGRLQPEEVRYHPHRSLLLRVMLGRDDNEADYSWLQPQLGDRYLLCSDGLSDMLTDEEIQRSLAAETIDAAAADLVRQALEAGGHDNVTVVIGELVEADAEPDDSLSCADGQPQLVGAAASSPRPRTGLGGHGKHPVGTGTEVDPEEVRYAPVMPTRWLRFRTVLALLAVIALVVLGCFLGYRWSQTQYYVSDADGSVAIYQGVPYDLPGVDLHHVEEVTDLRLSELTTYQQRQVREGIEASGREDAEQIIAELRPAEPEDTPITPTPAPTPVPDPAAPAPEVTP